MRCKPAVRIILRTRNSVQPLLGAKPEHDESVWGLYAALQSSTSRKPGTRCAIAISMHGAGAGMYMYVYVCSVAVCWTIGDGQLCVNSAERRTPACIMNLGQQYCTVRHTQVSYRHLFTGIISVRYRYLSPVLCYNTCTYTLYITGTSAR